MDFAWDSHWLEIWSKHLCPSMGPNGGSVAMNSVGYTQVHGRMNYKDTKPYMSAFLSVDLLTEFAAFCLTDFIDWRYIHS
jgi:hypothetical protein